MVFIDFTAVPDVVETGTSGYAYLDVAAGLLSAYGGLYSMTFVSDAPGVTLGLTGADPALTLDP